MSDIQLKGNLLADPAPGPAATNVSAFVSEFRVTTTRQGVTRPGTLATGASDTAAGLRDDALTITFFSSMAAADFWADLYAVISSASAELMFSGSMDEGVVNADNRKWTGTAVLLSLESGKKVGELREQTITLPIKQGTLVQTIVP